MLRIIAASQYDLPPLDAEEPGGIQLHYLDDQGNLAGGWQYDRTLPDGRLVYWLDVSQEMNDRIRADGRWEVYAGD